LLSFDRPVASARAARWGRGLVSREHDQWVGELGAPRAGQQRLAQLTVDGTPGT